MAFKGNLRDFTVTQLLNLINLARKTGTLIVEGPSEKIVVSFREGKLAYAQVSREDNGLVTILHRANRLTANQHSVIRQRANGMSDKELGLLLINANLISQKDIFGLLQSYAVGVVNRLFTWADGFFRFENDQLPPDGRILVKIGLENLILEGSRRMRELEQLKEEIPSLDMALKFTDRPSANIRKLNLSMDEWRVVSYINPKNTIRQIASATRLNDVEIRKIVYGMLQAGMVELVRPAGAEPVRPLPGRSLPLPSQKNKAEQKSLINRLISRIRSL